MIVIIEKNKNDKIEFTKEELEKLLKDTKDEGYNEGFKAGYISADKINIKTDEWWKKPVLTGTGEPYGVVHLDTTSTMGNIK